ncbi:NAD(P)H-binding protein [Embleya sp. AB8]|uniref:NAD(P)H-binding protein n=1 Tax=Embleya sp. AB8 TaxID=3156304 RepID=UPI003C744D73
MTVLVIGATGKTGRPVVDALVARGIDVRAASRNPAAASEGVVPVRFDWGDRATWGPALAGVDGLYLVGPFAEPDGTTLLRDLLAAAADVRRVVLMSVLGADVLGAATMMAGWEADLRASDKEWTILRPNWFQQNFAGVWADSLRNHAGIEVPAGDGSLAFVDTRDIGDVAAVVLAEPGHAGRVYDLTGPEALTLDRALAILSDAGGREFRYVPQSADTFAAGRRAAGAAESTITWYLALYALIRDGGNAVVTDTIERLTGHPARTLGAYAAEHAAVWRESARAPEQHVVPDPH